MHDPRRERYEAAFQFAIRQVDALVQHAPDYFPIYTLNGRWQHSGELWTDWTGGFLVGMMWKFYQRTGDEVWRQRAERYCRLLEHRKHDREVHDLGFIFLNSYLPWYELSGDTAVRDVLIDAGRTLAKRFNERGQYLRSFIGPESLFVDIMMNVPLILWVARETDDQDLRRIGMAHCRTTRDRLMRPDGSMAHEGIFDPQTGEFLRQSTHQGLSAESAWARGLAWSLYGFSQAYGVTGEKELLDTAECNADYWISHLPKDHVPYWDFDADVSQPAPWGAQKDSSAGAIAASALFDLELQTSEEGRAVVDRDTATAMLDSLCTPEYLALETPGWEAILKHGVYHTKKNLGVDESVMWGEFFFVEALDKALGHEAR
ncbi:MAG TPA: glycoside hydrolase family 88 protein [Pirellulales bacterium]|jgi:unsaturated chondroitin disaccharide hydrolase|nr:glycoside hydrolase family 88 protein [Pirellulales bacterium]